MIFLNWAYRVGDLSQVYPFARGIAPLTVAIVSAAFSASKSVKPARSRWFLLRWALQASP
jgi:hypothetical protein